MSQNYRNNIEELRKNLDDGDALAQTTISELLDELEDLRDIQRHSQELLACKFKISLPISGHGSKIFGIFRQLKHSITKYWNNRRNM